MKRSKENEKRQREYLDEIVDLLVLHFSVAITQSDYKGDFFKIFKDAYEHGYCTYTYHWDTESGIPVHRPNQLAAIDGDAIWTHAKERGWVQAEMSGEEKKYKDVSLLRIWWDEWIYAWGRHPKTVTHKASIKKSDDG